jgi:DNA-directed RNA polymerase II subunit RPB4
LNISEVALLLATRKKQNEDKNAGEASLKPDVEACLNYAQKFAKFSSMEAVEEIREILTNAGKGEDLEGEGLHKFEQAMLANLCPQDPEEAQALIPSLRIEELDLRDLLADMQAFQSFQTNN